MALKIPKQFRPKGQKSKLYKYKDEILDLREKGYSYDAIVGILKENFDVNIARQNVKKFIYVCNKSFKHIELQAQSPKPQEPQSPTPKPKQEQKLLFGKTDEQRIKEFRESAERIMREREAVLALSDPDED